MIIGLGETILDIIFKDDKPSAAVPGGSTYNAIISLGRTGVPATIVTETGSDHVGDIIVNYLTDNGVSTEYVNRRQDSKSHISLAFLNDRNDACYEFYKDHAHARIERRFPDITADDVLLFGSFFAVNPVLRDVVKPFIEKAHKAGAFIYYDINFRKSHIEDIPLIMDNINENMRFSTVVRGSLEDFIYLYGTDDVEEIYEKHISPFCPCFICTDGSKPLHLFTPSLHATYPTAPVKTVSTIGAGDNFNAGFIYGLHRKGHIDAKDFVSLKEEEWRDMIRYGQAFSSHVCTSFSNSISREFADGIV